MFASSPEYAKAVTSQALHAIGLDPKKLQPEFSSPQLMKLRALETQILKLSGLELNKDLQVFDVPIDYEGKNYIHTYRCGDQNPETLVLIHGYGGCSLLHFRIIKDLSQKYCVYSIDLLGMGLSSRPEFKCTNTEDTINYFVDSIEKWREVMGLESFYLSGHSFGGYMSCQYALKYQHRIKKLFLISPVGLTRSDEENNEPSVEQWLKTLSWPRRKMVRIMLKMWQTKSTIGAYYRNHSILGPFLLRRYLARQYGNKGQDKKLVEDLFKFFSALLKLEGGSDTALYYILRPPRARPMVPLEDLIVTGLNVPTVCYYGDIDWMNKEGTIRIIEGGKKNFKMKQIVNSGHQVPMHNAKMLAQELISELTGDPIIVTI